MTETADLAASEGQAEEAPVEPEGPTFGLDEVPDTPDDAPEEQSGQPEEESQSTTDTPDDSEEENKGYLRHDDYTRKTMDHAEEVKRFQQQQAEWNQQVATQQAQYQQALTQQQAAQTPQESTLAGQLQQIASDPNLTPQDRAGLGVVANLAKTVEEQKAVIDWLRQSQEYYTGQFQQTNQAVQGLTENQQAALVNDLRTQMSEAADMFGQETVDDQMGFVRKIAVENGQWTPEVNVTTGKPYTVAELVAWGSGKSAEQLQEAKNAQRNGRLAAKKQVASTGTTSGSPNGPALSMADAIAEIQSTQSGGTI